MMNKNSLIYIAGHTGLVGSAICRALARTGYANFLTRSHAELDLCDQDAVRKFFEEHTPEIVIMGAARVGGIHANSSYPAEFICQNLQIQTNIIDSAWRNKCQKLLFLGSSCIYPRECPQPIREEYLLTGPLESTNDAYAIAKIAGIKMCQAYRRQYAFDAISVMPTNLYGPGDNYHPENSHVLPALIRRFHEARISGADSVTIWGSGKPMREFLHSDDMADACVFLLENYSDAEPINVGSGVEISIIELAALVARVVGYGGKIETDPQKSDGTPRKLLDCSKLFALGWKPATALEDGIRTTYRDFLSHEQLRRN